MHKHILIVDDEPDILELLAFNLSQEGFRVTCVLNGENALAVARDHVPDLVLLDLMLPDVDGFEVCRQLKSAPRTSHIPIVMLTAKGEEVDIVTGLELGADDYVTKPFSPRVLIARLRAALRREHRGSPSQPSVLKVHDIEIDPVRYTVTADQQSSQLTATEFNILQFLAEHPGWVFTRNQIIEAVKGKNYPVTERSVDVQVVGLRKKLRNAGSLIETVRGIGYRFKE